MTAPVLGASIVAGADVWCGRCGRVHTARSALDAGRPRGGEAHRLDMLFIACGDSAYVVGVQGRYIEAWDEDGYRIQSPTELL